MATLQSLQPVFLGYFMGSNKFKVSILGFNFDDLLL